MGTKGPNVHGAISMDLSFDGNTLAVFIALQTVKVYDYGEERRMWVSTITATNIDVPCGKEGNIQISGDGSFLAVSDCHHNSTWIGSGIVQTLELTPSAKEERNR